MQIADPRSRKNNHKVKLSRGVTGVANDKGFGPQGQTTPSHKL